MALNPELAKIADAWDKNTGDGRDENARKLAEKYVRAHPEIFAGLQRFTLPQLVTILSGYRDEGDDENQWNVEAYLLAKFAPQQIGGTYQAEIRLADL